LPEGTGDVAVDPWSIVKILLTVQLIPLCGGIAIRRARPAWADRFLKFVPRIGQIGLLISVGYIFWGQIEQISAIRVFEHWIILLMVVASLLIGDLTLIGETMGRRRSLAIVTAIRNVPLAFLIANTSFPGTTVGSVVLIFSMFSISLSLIYGKLRIGGGNMERTA
jgi:BASS family bile acid:Na+ symporter